MKFLKKIFATKAGAVLGGVAGGLLFGPAGILPGKAIGAYLGSGGNLATALLPGVADGLEAVVGLPDLPEEAPQAKSSVLRKGVEQVSTANSVAPVVPVLSEPVIAGDAFAHASLPEVEPVKIDCATAAVNGNNQGLKDLFQGAGDPVEGRGAALAANDDFLPSKEHGIYGNYDGQGNPSDRDVHGNRPRDGHGNAADRNGHGGRPTNIHGIG